MPTTNLGEQLHLIHLMMSMAVATPRDFPRAIGLHRGTTGAQELNGPPSSRGVLEFPATANRDCSVEDKQNKIILLSLHLGEKDVEGGPFNVNCRRKIGNR